MAESLQERVARLKNKDESLADRVARIKGAKPIADEVDAERKRAQIESSMGSGQMPEGVMDALGIPGRVIPAAIRSLQEMVGGDPSKPWEHVVTGKNRDLALDMTRAVTSPSGNPPERQDDATGLEKVVSLILGTAVDPLSYVPVEKAVAPAMKIVSKGIKGAELAGAKLAGAVAEPLTIGRITKEGMEHAVKDFTPVEQIFAKSTLDKVRKSYGPLKEATDKALVGRISPDDLNFAMQQIDVPKGLESAVDDLGVAYDKLRRQLSTTTKVGHVPQSDVGAPVLQAIVGKLDEIKSAGKIDAVQAAEIQDMLNQLKYTPLGNPKSVPANFKSAYSGLQGQLADVINKSAPELGKGRAAYHAAASMNVGRSGGKMTEMIRQADINQAILEATDALQSADAGMLSRAIGTVAVKSGPAWNAFVGALRIPSDIAAKGRTPWLILLLKIPRSLRRRD